MNNVYACVQTVVMAMTDVIFVSGSPVLATINVVLEAYKVEAALMYVR